MFARPDGEDVVIPDARVVAHFAASGAGRLSASPSGRATSGGLSYAPSPQFRSSGLYPDFALMADWACLAPKEIAPRIWEAIASMAERMAGWVSDDWRVQTEADLDRYTFAVAGATGILLCDLRAWAEGEQLHRSVAIQFGRGSQAVHILRNRSEDLARGVDFFPAGWTKEQMQQYAWKHLVSAEDYAQTIPSAPFEMLMQIPLTLAKATLQALTQGESKLSRSNVR